MFYGKRAMVCILPFIPVKSLPAFISTLAIEKRSHTNTQLCTLVMLHYCYYFFSRTLISGGEQGETGRMGCDVIKRKKWLKREDNNKAELHEIVIDASVDTFETVSNSKLDKLFSSKRLNFNDLKIFSMKSPRCVVHPAWSPLFQSRRVPKYYCAFKYFCLPQHSHALKTVICK